MLTFPRTRVKIHYSLPLTMFSLRKGVVMVLYQLVAIEKTYVMSVMFMNLSESGYFSSSGHCVYKVMSLIFLMWDS